MPKPIPLSVRREVLARDGQCVAPLLDREADPCRDRFGGAIDWTRISALMADVELDHVRGKPAIGELSVDPVGGFGRRPPHESRFLQTVCYHHHHDGWATRAVNRDRARERLARLYPQEAT